MSRHALAFLSAAVVTAWAVPASAHIVLTDPPARYSMDFIKDAPCGMVGNPAGPNPPTVLQAGEMYTIRIDEFVNHGGHFRVAFSEDGSDQFVSPTDFDDFYTDDQVLLDDIADNQNGGEHQIDFVVPDVNCDPCTLQVLQIMSGGSFSEDSLYYTCADIVIENASGGTTSGTTDGGSVSATATVTVTAGDTSSDGGDDGTTGGDGTTASVDDAADDAPADSSGDVGPATDNSASDSSSTDPGSDDDDSGCSCTTNPRSNAVWALALFAIALRRRRR